MKKIMQFNGKRAILKAESSDLETLRNQLVDNDYREIHIFTKRDLDMAVEHGCQIYQKTFDDGEILIERLFVRVKREDLFSVAEKVR
jgi:hypothetical protein